MKGFDRIVEGKWELVKADAQLLELLDALRAAGRTFMKDQESSDLQSQLDEASKTFALALAVRDAVASSLDFEAAQTRLRQPE